MKIFSLILLVFSVTLVAQANTCNVDGVANVASARRQGLPPTVAFDCNAQGQRAENGSNVCFQVVDVIYADAPSTGPFTHGSIFVMNREGRVQNRLGLYLGANANAPAGTARYVPAGGVSRQSLRRIVGTDRLDMYGRSFDEKFDEVGVPLGNNAAFDPGFIARHNVRVLPRTSVFRGAYVPLTGGYEQRLLSVMNGSFGSGRTIANRIAATGSEFLKPNNIRTLSNISGRPNLEIGGTFSRLRTLANLTYQSVCSGQGSGQGGGGARATN
jgi:hypothetical protein